MGLFDSSEEVKIKDFSVREVKKAKSGAVEKYPFSKLEVGQGFDIPSGVSIQSMRCLAYQRGKTLGRKFAVSTLGTVERTA